MRFFSSVLAVVVVTAVQMSAVNAIIAWGRMCEHANFGGQCTDFGSENAQCISFNGGNSFWNDKVSSIKVSDGPFNINACIFYNNLGCTGAGTVYTPGHGPYNSLGANNDQHSSFKCANPGY